MSKFLKTYSYLRPMNGLTAGSKCTVSHTIHATPCFEVAYATGVKPPLMSNRDRVEASLDVEWAHVTAEGADIVFVEAATTGNKQPDGRPVVGGRGQGRLARGVCRVDVVGPDRHHQSRRQPLRRLYRRVRERIRRLRLPRQQRPALPVGVLLCPLRGRDPTVQRWGSGSVVHRAVGPSTTPRAAPPTNWTGSQARTGSRQRRSYNAVDYPITVNSSWLTANGVSAGIPQWAGLIADADQDRASLGKSVLAAEGLLDGIYLAAGSHGAAPPDPNKAMFDDITEGSAGSKGVCHASTGWDWPTGLGTPHADALVNELADL